MTRLGMGSWIGLGALCASVIACGGGASGLPDAAPGDDSGGGDSGQAAPHDARITPADTGTSHDAATVAPDVGQGGMDGGGADTTTLTDASREETSTDTGPTNPDDATPPGADAAQPMNEDGKICPAVSAGDTETYGLSATTSLPTGISSMTNWTQNPGSGGWNGRQVKDACRYEADPAGFVTAHGMPSARVELDPGDDPLDLGENTERAELLGFQDVTGTEIQESSSSGKQFYATSYFFPTSWAATFYPYSAFEASGSTWPAGTSSDCSSGDGNECNSWSFVMQFYPWAALVAASNGPGKPQTMWFSSGSQTFDFSDGGQLSLGQWMDLVLEIDWASGDVTIWRRNEGQTQFTQVVIGTASSPPSGVYTKQGLYRGGNVNGRTDVYWVGPTARGASFTAVEKAAFGTTNGP